VNTTNTLYHLTAFEYKENGLKFHKVHNKMKNVWVDLHPLKEGEWKCNLGDYNLFSIANDIVAALQEGLQQAQSMLRISNMVPMLE